MAAPTETAMLDPSNLLPPHFTPILRQIEEAPSSFDAERLEHAMAEAAMRAGSSLDPAHLEQALAHLRRVGLADTIRGE